jgi:hypothetical protein
MAQTEHPFWKWIKRLSDILKVATPLFAAISWLGAILLRKLPSVANVGSLGVIVIALALFFFLGLLTLLIYPVFTWNRTPKKITRGGSRKLITPQNSSPNSRLALAMWVLSGVVALGAFAIKDDYPAMPPGIDVSGARLPIATYSDLKKDQIIGKTVFIFLVPRAHIRVPGLPGLVQQIVGKDFENCDFFGPAVLGLGGTSVVENDTIGVNFGVPSDAYFLHVKGKYSAGAIPITDCVIRNCTLINVAFSGDEDLLKRLRDNIKDSTIP